MRTTIDSAGRVVIPKAIREEARLEAGAPLDVVFRDGRIEIEAASAPMRLVKGAGGATIQADGEMPPLTSEDVRDTLDRVRR
jgi:AbrB family looped-hinge helix DNA binding protein